MNVYLKYIHGGSSSINEILEKADQLEQERVEGRSNKDEINSLHSDAKEDGGVERIVSMGFTKNSYKSAAKKKTKGKMYEASISIHQTGYSSTGNAWKVWDSSIVLARWCYAYQEKFKYKSVHEIGSGCGLVGLLVSLYCDRITVSDYKEEILENIRKNVQLNGREDQNIEIKNVDFEKIYHETSTVTEDDKVDILLGSDVIYGLHLSEWLPRVVDRFLKQEGIFYLVNPKSRLGVDEFVDGMERLGMYCSVQTVDEKYCDDFVKKSCWDLITCSRNKENTRIQLAHDSNSEEEYPDLENSFFHHKELKKTLKNEQ